MPTGRTAVVKTESVQYHEQRWTVDLLHSLKTQVALPLARARVILHAEVDTVESWKMKL